MRVGKVVGPPGMGMVRGYAIEKDNCLPRPPGDEVPRLEGSHPMNRVLRGG